MKYSKTALNKIKKEICEISKLLYEKNFITSKEGNLSYRIQNKIYITPSGVPKFMLKEKDIAEVTFEMLEKGDRGQASSEVFTHFQVYKDSKDTVCILHAHPENTLVLNLMGYDFSEDILAESIVFLENIETSKYATPGTPEGAEAVKNISSDIIILDRHGVIIKSKTNLWDAFFKLEILEKYSSIVYKLISSGKEYKKLPKEEVEKLKGYLKSK